MAALLSLALETKLFASGMSFHRRARVVVVVEEAVVGVEVLLGVGSRGGVGGL